MRNTENPRDPELRRRLSRFETVWRRVSASRSPRAAAEERGVKLMPRKCCRRRWR